MADKLLVNPITTAELATLVSTSALVEGLQYKNTETGVLYLALSQNTVTIVPTIDTTQFITYVKKIVLTDSQIKTLPNVPVELLPAPGVGKALFCNVAIGSGGASFVFNNIAHYGSIDSAANFYFNVDNMIATSYGKTAEVDGFLNWGAIPQSWVLSSDSVGTIFAASNDLNTWENKSLELSMENGAQVNLTGGDPSNTLTLFITYSIIDL